MNPKTTNFFFGVVLIFVLAANPLHAQPLPATLSGTLTDSFGKAVPNAKITVKNSSTGQAIEGQTDSSGVFTIHDLAAGDYEVSV